MGGDKRVPQLGVGGAGSGGSRERRNGRPEGVRVGRAGDRTRVGEVRGARSFQKEGELGKEGIPWL